MVELPARLRDEWSRYVRALVALIVCTLIMVVFRDALGVLNVTLLYVILSAAIGLTLGAGPGAATALLAFFAFDVLFIEPYYTFTVDDSDHVLALVVYLGVAVGTSLGAARLRSRTEEAIFESRRTTVLYELNRALLGDVTIDGMLHTLARSVVEIYGSTGCRVLILVDNGLAVRARFPESLPGALARQDEAMALWVMAQRSIAGMSTGGRRIRAPHGTTNPDPRPEARPGRDTLFVPIIAGATVTGAVQVIGKPGGGRFTASDERILATFADQAALALQRASLQEEATRASILERTGELKSALLAAVSHDLRTPLAAIKTSASTILSPSITLDEADEQELLVAIDEETDRLTLMVSNLLDLSRIEGGALRPDRDWHEIDGLLDDLRARTRRLTEDHPLTMTVEPDLPLVLFDFVQISQVLINLVGNAVKYSASGSLVVLDVAADARDIEFTVRDSGVGIRPDHLPHVFETFFRADNVGAVAGSGIGLAICRGLVEAHGGAIRAESQVGIGTTITFTLPIGDDAAGDEGS